MRGAILCTQPEQRRDRITSDPRKAETALPFLAHLTPEAGPIIGRTGNPGHEVLRQEELMGFQFGAVLTFAVVAVLFALVALLTGAIIRPRFPNANKVSIYECGERPIGTAWYNFNPRFYLIALAFVIFEVDIALTFPVVVVYANGPSRATAGSP